MVLVAEKQLEKGEQSISSPSLANVTVSSLHSGVDQRCRKYLRPWIGSESFPAVHRDQSEPLSSTTRFLRMKTVQVSRMLD